MIATLDRKLLGQLLVSRGLIKEESLDQALAEQGRGNHQKLLGEVLVEMRCCTEDQVIEVLAQTYNVPYARVSPHLADPKAVAALPKEFLEKHLILPLFLVEGTLTVAVTEPANVFLVEEIERLGGHPVQIVAATARDIKATLQTYLPSEHVFVIDDIIDDVSPGGFSVVERPVQEVVDTEQAANDAPVIRLVNYCIYNAVKESASDVHIEPGENTLRVRYRIDGRLVEKIRPPFQMHAGVASRLKIMAGLDASQRRVPQEGDIRVMMEHRPVDLHVSIMPARYGEKIAIRIMDHEKGRINLEKLGFSYETLKLWRRLTALPSGMLLITGPNDSGKSSTLYASLQEINADDINICTLEDPVDYALPGINQFEFSDKAGVSYTSALQSLMRQDPDVVMMSEIRDVDAARIAAQAALEGRRVFSTMNANDAPSAITRLFSLGLEPYLVGASLTGVLAQRLVRKLCQSCMEPYAPSIPERRQLEKTCGSGNLETLHRPRGCPRCRNLGYSGRIGIHELLAMDDTLVDLLSQGASLQVIRDAARAAGMRSLRMDGLEKVKAGITTLEEIQRVTA